MAHGYIVVAVAYVAVVIYGFAQGRDVSLASVDRVPDTF
jgi:hypothetical protein